MYTFNISHIILQFIRYSLENGNKNDKNSELTVAEQMNLIMSDNLIERFVMDYNQPKIIQLLHLSTQLDHTNLGQNVTNQCLILFSLLCKKIALVIKEKTHKQNMVRSKCLNIF